MKTRKLIYVLITVVVMISSVAQVSASAGTFKDRDGASHTWSIGESHELVWDGTPYIPFGTIFKPESLNGESSDASFKADTDAVEALHKAGVTDVILRADSIATVSTAALQRVIDLLETSGIRYGIDLRDAPYLPLEGYVVNPAVNRVEGIRSSGMVSRNYSDSTTAAYALCDAGNGEVKRVGEVADVNGMVTIPVTLRGDSAHVLLIFPHKVITDQSSSWGLPDLWTDYSRHRDRLVAQLSHLKFGKGLRFFIDPFGADFGVKGESEMLVPGSPSYRLQYAAWLSRKYPTLRDLSVAWGLTQRDASSYEEAARYVPLWWNGRGVGYVYDPSTGTKYAVDTAVSAVWPDFLDFRTKSIRAWMDGIADVVKRTDADVPVVFSAPGLRQMFSPEGSVGFDGLAVSPGAKTDSIIQSTGEVLSVAERAQRKVWMLSKLRPAGSSFDKKETLFSAINTSRGLGSKGFFAEETENAAGSAGWLSEYASLCKNDKNFASYRPDIVYYPKDSVHAQIKRLGGGTWWLPTDGLGRSLDLGSKFAGYSLEDAKTGVVEIYAWSLHGKQTVHIAARAPITISSGSDEQEIKPKKNRLEITLTEEPLVIRGIAPGQFIPYEVAEDLIAQMEKGIQAVDAKHIDITAYKLNLERVKELLKSNQVGVSADMARVNVDEINRFLDGLNSFGGINKSTK